MHLPLVLLPLLVLLGLANGQGSPIDCLVPSNSSFVVSAGALLPPVTGCPAFGVIDPIYLVWPDYDNLVVIFLGNQSANGSWTEPVFFPTKLPVYGYGWIMMRYGSVINGPAMFEFASELSHGFAILQSAPTNASSSLRPGDVRLLVPSDVPVLWNQSTWGEVPVYPTADRILLEVSEGASSRGQTVDILLYGLLIAPYPAMILGENVPLPAPGDQLDYFLNVSLSADLSAGPLQVVVVPSLAALDEVIAVSGPFVFAGSSGAGNTSAAPPSYSLKPSSIVTLDGTSFSAGVTVSDYSNAPPSAWTTTDAPPSTASMPGTSSSAAPTSHTASSASLLTARSVSRALLVLGASVAVVVHLR